MDTGKYRLVFEGRLRKGANRQNFIQKLAQALKLEPSQAEAALFRGHPVVVQKNLSPDQARQYLEKLLALGGMFKIEPQEPVTPEPPKPLPAQTPTESPLDEPLSPPSPKKSTDPFKSAKDSKLKVNPGQFFKMVQERLSEAIQEAREVAQEGGLKALMNLPSFRISVAGLVLFLVLVTVWLILPGGVSQPSRVIEVAAKKDKGLHQKRKPRSLTLAVAKKDLPRVLSILKKEGQSFTQEVLTRALFEAVEVGFEKALDPLVQAGADVNSRNLRGANLLQIVQEKDPHNLFSVLATLPIKAEFKDQALKHAVLKIDIKACRALLDAGANPNLVDVDGDSLLLGAIRKKHPQLALALLEKTVDVHYQTAGNRPESPLGLALEKKLVGVARRLVEKGALSSLPDWYGSAIKQAIEMGSVDLVKTLIFEGGALKVKKVMDSDLLIAAVKKRNLSLVQMLLAHGMAANQRNDEGNSPLIEAIGLNEPQIVTTLLEAGAEPNQSDIGELSAMDAAVGEGRPELIEVLKSEGGVDRLAKVMEKVVGKYPNSMGLQEGVLTILSASGKTLTLSIKTFQEGGCELSERRVELQYNSAQRNYQAILKEAHCTLIIQFVPEKEGKPWVFIVKQEGVCKGICSRQGIMVGHYHKNAP